MTTCVGGDEGELATHGRLLEVGDVTAGLPTEGVVVVVPRVPGTRRLRRESKVVNPLLAFGELDR